jgi:hypothetical protein
MPYYEFHLADHKTMNEITYLFPVLQATKDAKLKADSDYEQIRYANEYKTRHAMAAYHDYEPVFVDGKFYYDEQYRKLVKDAYQNTLDMAHAYHELRIQYMALIFTPKRVSGLGQY